MGDCAKLRCVHEKRQIRKELSSWYKKVPYVVGLELVAGSLAGGHMKTLLLPFNDMETEEVEDFEYNKPPVCIFCDSKSTEDVFEPESIPESATYNKQITTDTTPRTTPTTTRHNKDITGSPASSSIPDMQTIEGLNSFYNQLAMTSLLYQQQQLQSAAVVKSALAGRPSTSSNHKQSPLLLGMPADNGFDTQVPPSCSAALNQLSAVAAAETDLKIPEIRRKMKKDLSAKKTYTDTELNAAIEAIKSGTIGTRKAAHMYGVPRSTLRNKVCKSTEMSRQVAEYSGTLSETAALNGSSESPPLSKSDSESQTSSPNNKHSQQRTRTGNGTTNTMAQYNDILMKQLDDLKAKQGINDHLNMLNHHNRILGEMLNPLQFAAAASYPFFMPQYPALTGMTAFDYMNPYASSMMMPYLPELMKNLTQKQLESDRAGQLAASLQPTRKSEPNTSSKQTKVCKDDIKVPAYKPSINHDHPTSLTKSRSKSLSKDQTENLSDLPPNFSTASFLQRMMPSTTSASAPKQSTNTPSKRTFAESSHNSSQQIHSSLQNGCSSGKKRPKRGQYRKYDSELLAQAVRSVQRGEMSVHRAGTHYGVPHSTLEYKVKERHLLRKKKIAENGEHKAHLAVSTPITTAATSMTTSNNPQELRQSKTKLSSPKLESNDLNTDASRNNENLAKELLNIPKPYNLNTSASDLLMKLHDKAHQNAMNEIINGGEKMPVE